MSSPEQAHELHYAPRVESEVRRGHLRRVTRIVFAVAVATVLLAVSVRAVRHVLYLRVQRECMTYVAPPETIVFDGVTARSAAPPSAATFLSEGNPIVFVHQRETPQRDSRIVAVAMVFAQNELFLYGDEYTPATLVLRSTVSQPLPIGRSLRLPARARIFAGQPDQSDATHFTIDYELNGQRSTIDGWLMNDGEVKLEPRGQSIVAPATLPG